MEEMATRMKLAMMKVICVALHSQQNILLLQNETNWVVSNLAALYWRIVGDGVQSLKCLKHALYHAPSHNKVNKEGASLFIHLFPYRMLLMLVWLMSSTG